MRTRCTTFITNVTWI